jgi:Retrotransposon gag protein
MNFEELERNISIHILRHFTHSYTREPLNEDFTCNLCYPPPPLEENSIPFQNFWIWFQYEHRAETFSAYTVVTFNLFEQLFNTAESDYRTNRLQAIVIRLLSSIRYRTTPFSAEVLLHYIQGLADRTHCFQRPVDLSISSEVLQEIYDQELINIQRVRLLLRQILSSPTPSASSLSTTTPPGTPPTGIMTTATATELTTLFQSIFGIDGANLTNIAQQMQNHTNAAGQSERTTIKVDSFSGAEGEDPVEWLTTFERAATTNRWTDAARKKAIAGGHLKGAAADWFEEVTATMGNNWNTGQNGGNNFVDLFNKRFVNETKKNQWYHDLTTLRQQSDESVDSYTNKFNKLATRVGLTDDSQKK